VPGRRDLGVAKFARSSALANPGGGGARFAIGRADMNVAAKPDDISEAQRIEKAEQLGVAEAAIGQNRHRDASGQNLRQTGEAQVLEIVALVPQLVLQHRQPQQGRRPAVIGDKAQGQCRLIVGVEIRPVHGDDNGFALADDLRDPGGEHVPHNDAPVAQQAIDLLDGVLAQQAARLGQGLADDRHREGRARHDAQRAISKGHHALGVKPLGEDAIEIFLNKLNALDRMVHGDASSG